MEGWIKLHRKIRENPVFNDMNLLRLWLICLTEATHKERDQMVGKQIVRLMPGEFVTGRFDLNEMYNKGLSKKEKKPPTTVWRWLENLEKHEFVVIKSNNKFSVVSVLKWSEYQSKEDESGQQVVNKWSTDGQQVVTNKNVKNDKNDKEDKPSRPKQVYDTDSIPYRSAKYLLKKIMEFKPDLKQPNIQTWSNEMRLLIEVDGKDPVKVGQVIDWIFKDDFWSTAILSPSKLRKQWDTVTAKMNRPSNKSYQSKAERDAEEVNALKLRILQGGAEVAATNETRSRIDVTPNQNNIPKLYLEQ